MRFFTGFLSFFPLHNCRRRHRTIIIRPGCSLFPLAQFPIWKAPRLREIGCFQRVIAGWRFGTSFAAHSRVDCLSDLSRRWWLERFLSNLLSSPSSLSSLLSLQQQTNKTRPSSSTTRARSPTARSSTPPATAESPSASPWAWARSSRAGTRASPSSPRASAPS